VLAHCSARRAAYVLHRPCWTARPHNPLSFQKRTLTIETFTNGFLDLATALPSIFHDYHHLHSRFASHLDRAPFNKGKSPTELRVSSYNRFLIGKAETAARGGRGHAHNQLLKTWCVETGSRRNAESFPEVVSGTDSWVVLSTHRMVRKGVTGPA
jgi:hypothetical protein